MVPKIRRSKRLTRYQRDGIKAERFNIGYVK